MVFIIFSQMLSLLVLMLVGFYIGKKQMIDSHTMSQLSQVISFIFNPMLCLSAALSGYGKADRTIWLQLFAVVMLVFVVMVLVSYLIAPFFDRRPGQKEMIQMMFIFVNIGYIGIPVIKGTFGSEYTIYVLTVMVAYNLFFYTFGLALLDGGFTLKSMKGMINTGTVSTVIGLILFWFEIPIPDFLVTSIDYLADLVSPLAMILVGVTLAASDLRVTFFNCKIWLFNLVRMLAFPMLCLPFIKMLPFEQTLQAILIVEIGMPVGNLPLIVGTAKGIDGTNCSAGIIITTISAVVTLPILMLFFR